MFHIHFSSIIQYQVHVLIEALVSAMRRGEKAAECGWRRVRTNEQAREAVTIGAADRRSSRGREDEDEQMAAAISERADVRNKTEQDQRQGERNERHI